MADLLGALNLIQELQNKKSIQDNQKYIQLNCVRKTKKWKIEWHKQSFTQHMQSCIYRTNRKNGL